MSRAVLPMPPVIPAGGRSSAPDDQATRLRAMVQAAERPAPVRPTRFELHPDPQSGPRAKVITVSSGKGGVGKTNTCVNLAIALAQAGRRITLLDADLGMANADVLCGLSPARRLEHFVGVSDSTPSSRPSTPNEALALARRSLRDLAIDAPGGFRLIPGAVGVARMAALAPRERARLMAGVADLERDTDLLLVDTGAGLGREVISLIHAADLALIIATPEPTSIADAYALIKCALRAPSDEDRARPLRPGGGDHPSMALVVNMAADQREAAAVHARIAAVCERFLRCRLPLLGWITQDARVGAAVRRRTPLLLDNARCQASRDLRALATALAAAVSPAATSAKTRSGVSSWLSKLVLRGS